MKDKIDGKQKVINILDGLSALEREIFCNQESLSKITDGELRGVNNKIDELERYISLLWE